jgi:hypothetical protein
MQKKKQGDTNNLEEYNEIIRKKKLKTKFPSPLFNGLQANVDFYNMRVCIRGSSLLSIYNKEDVFVTWCPTGNLGFSLSGSGIEL